jgi:hypothetical protein
LARRLAARRQPPGPVFEVHVFLATAEARDSVAAGCAAGERHALLVFSRQAEGEAPDEPAARKGASAAGWKAIRIERSRRLSATAVPEEEVLRAAFREALRDGVAVVAHRRSEDRKPGPATARAALRK